MYQVKIEQFQGPFDVLLTLIEKREVDITSVSLCDIADSFVESINESQLTTQELVDFLSIAVKLLYLKSKELLPGEEEEADEDVQDLKEQLRRYQKFKQASEGIELIIKAQRFAYSISKQRKVEQAAQTFSPPQDLNTQTLESLFKEVIKRLSSYIIIPKSTIQKVRSLQDVMQVMNSTVSKQSKTSFFKLIDKGENKVDLIVHFLSMLELTKQKEIDIHQEELFHDIMIKKRN